MKTFQLNTPVLFLTFNRIDTTKKVFQEIKKAKPKQLFLASDGPRNENEKKVVQEIRDYLLKNITWKCKVKTLFREKNLGCKYAVSSAINWFFENVEQGIILEDDCLPSQSFFRFCQEMLEKYKDDERIMQISGTNVEVKSKIQESYFFSRCFNAWGWATWKRAWKLYDVEMKDWKSSLSHSKKIRNKQFPFSDFYGRRIIRKIISGELNTWDYQWIFYCLVNNSFSIIPKNNLITNLGFLIGTHTTNYGKSKSLERYELEFPLRENCLFLENIHYKSVFNLFFKKGRIIRFLLKKFNSLSFIKTIKKRFHF
jgi:hypothetical protein